MRIALASIHPRPLSGQIEGLVGLAQVLERLGHSVKLVSAFPSPQLLGPDRLRLASKPHRIFVDQPVRMTRILVRLVRLGPQVDVIHLNLPTPSFSIFADLLQTFVRVPVVVGYEAHLVSVRDLLRHDGLREAPEFYLPRLLVNNRVVASLALHRAASYVVSSQHQKWELSKLGIAPERIHILPTVLPQDKVIHAPREQVRSSLPAGRLVTYIGHFNHVKGVEVLVRAFEELARRVPDLRLVLAWSGVGASRRIEQMLRGETLAGRVLRLGQMHVADLLAASDVVVLPYRLTIGQAAHPAALLEALSANVPVVTSDLPLLRELTQDGTTALLVPPDAPAALARAIERVLSDAALVQEMLEAQRRWMQPLQPRVVARDYERLYEQVTSSQAAVLRPARDRKDV